MQDNNTPIYRVALANGKSKDYTEKEYRDLDIAGWLDQNHHGQYNVFKLSNAPADSVTKDQQYVVSITQNGQTKSKLYSGQEFMDLDMNGWLEANHSGNYQIQSVRGYSDASLAVNEDTWKKQAERQKAALDKFDEDNKAFMQQHEADTLVYDAGEGVMVDNDKYRQDELKYQDLTNQRQALQSEYSNNPYIRSQYKAEAEYADQKAAEYEAEKNKRSRDDDDYRYFSQAKKLEKDAAKTWAVDVVQAPGENGFADYMSNYGKGAGKVFSDRDFWTRGISAISRDLNIRKIFKKLQDKGFNLNEITEKELDENLTPGEKALIYSFVRLADAQAARAKDMAPGYTAGQTAADSAGFMAEFFITGGLGKVAGSALKEGAQQGLRAFIGRALTTGSAEAIRSATSRGMINAFTKGGQRALTQGMKQAVKAGTAAATGVYKYGVRPVEEAAWHTALQLSTYRTIADDLTQIDNNGKLVEAGTAIWGGVLDSFIENWSESMGDFVNDVIGLPFKGAAGLGKKLLGETSLTQWGRWLADTTAAKVLTQAGFHGLIGEMGEEWLGNAARVGLGLMSGDEFKDFRDLHNQLDMAASFAPMSLFGLGSSSYAAAREAKNYRQTVESFRGVLNRTEGMTQEEIANIFDTKHTKKEIADILTPVLQKIVHGRETNSTAFEDYITTLKMAQALSMHEVVSTAQSIEKNLARDEMRRQIETELGSTTDADGRGKFTHRMATERLDENGNPYELEAVTTVKDADGNEWFYMGDNGSQVVLKKRGEAGGKPMFLTQTEYEQKVESGEFTQKAQLADQFLDEQVQQKRTAERQARANQEIQDRYSALLKRFHSDPNINLGTEDAPLNGTVMSVGYDGVIVDFGQPVLLNGETLAIHKLSLEQAGNAVGLDTSMRSEEQRDADAVDRDEKARKRVASYNRTFSGKDFTINGNPYTYVKMFEAPFLDENGNEMVRVVATDAQGVDVEVALPLADLESQALTQQEREQSDADIERTDEETSTDNSGSPKDFRGNDIPMRVNEKTGEEEVDKREFKKRDPEAYYKWNDSRRGGNTADSMEAIQADIAAKSKERETLAKQKSTETDPDVRDELEGQITRLDNEINLLSGINRKYEAANNFQELEKQYWEQFREINQRLLDAKSQEQIEELQQMLRDLRDGHKKNTEKSVWNMAMNEHTVELQKALNEIADLPVLVTTEARVKKDMANDGASQEQIDKVDDQLAYLENQRETTGKNFVLNGFHCNGKVYIFAEGNADADAAIVTYYHERQHDINEHNPEALNTVSALFNGNRKALFKTLESIIGDASPYEKSSSNVLADEIVAFTMEKAHTNPNYIDELKALGLSDELINIISTEYGRQRDNVQIHDSRSEDGASRDGNRGQTNYRIDEQSNGRESGNEQLGRTSQSDAAENSGRESGEVNIGRESGSGQEQELQSIIERAKADGTYMKAPNGKRSHLDERQWAQVRTDAFKSWFGDWEIAAFAANVNRAWNESDYKFNYAFRPSDALASRLKEILGKDIKSLHITGDSVRHFKKNHSENEELRGQENLTVEDLYALPYLLNNYDSAKPRPDYDDKMGNRAIEVRKRINGTTLIGLIEKGKDKEYVVTGYRLVKSSDALDASSEAPGPNVRNDSDIAKVQKDIESIKESIANSSKVVDENGEPRVVLHLSGKDFTVFGEGINTNTQSFGFFTDDQTQIEEYADKAATVYKSNVIRYYSFLNLRNPLVIDFEGSPFYDPKGEAEKYGGSTDNIVVRVKAGIYGDYDGVIFKNVGDEFGGNIKNPINDFVPFAPNQVKSATKNNGDFSNENNDIRYRTSETAQALSPTGKTAEEVVNYSIIRKDEVDAASYDYWQSHKDTVSEEIYSRGQQAMDEMAAQMRPYYGALAKGNRILPLEQYGGKDAKSTIFNNASYGRTIENTLKCMRTLAYNEFTDAVKEKLGRPLTQRESFLASQMVYDIATDPQCLYCYVSLDRKAYDDFLLKYVQQRDAILEKYRALPKKLKNIGSKAPNAALSSLYGEFLAGRKDTPQMKSRFNAWIRNEMDGTPAITTADLTTKAVRNAILNGLDAKVAAQVADAEKYAQSASWAKKDVDYISYIGELLKMSPNVVHHLLEEYGLRFYSFSEFTPAFILENMQMVRDAALRGLNGLAYTKEIDFVKIFAPTGMNINISCYGRRDADGNFVMDTRQGADWEEAKKLREQYPNVAISFTVTSDEDVNWALEQDFVDVIIPFHIVRTGEDIANFYGWTNYSAKQADQINGTQKKKYISPVDHHNNKEHFLALCKEENITPRFVQFVEHPNYMRLVNETRRSIDETVPLQPVFDMASAQDCWNRFVEKGGYYNGWWQCTPEEYIAAVDRVVEDVKAGKEANEVDYGRQDIPINPERAAAAHRRAHQHGNRPLYSGFKAEQQSESAEESNAEVRFREVSERKQWIGDYVNAVHLVTGKDKKVIRAELNERVAEAKEEARELYGNVLSGNFNSVTLQQIDNYIDNATNGNRFYRPLSQRLRERALLSLQGYGRENEVDALFSRICESAVPANERTRAEGRRKIEARKEELLEGWAKATGNWHESIADFTSNTEPIGHGTDSEVYVSDDGESVIKASKGKFDNKKFPTDIDQVALFNSVFPRSGYTILGYGRVNGKFVKYLKQPFIDFSTATPLTVEERVAYMHQLGYEPQNEEQTVFSNGDIVVSDLQKSNIVKDIDGNIRVIDADVKLHTKDIGGNYTYAPVEYDTDIDGNPQPLEANTESDEPGMEEASVEFRTVQDPALLDRLNNEETISVYQSAVKIGDNYYPPMATLTEEDENGRPKLGQPVQFGTWLESEEHPERIAKSGRYKGRYPLREKGKTTWVAYNPYLHTTASPLNDQFTAAHKKPLVVLEVRVPKSELAGTYHAEGAQDSTGEKPWHKGPVSAALAKLGKDRKVILTRWAQPVREVPAEEIADKVADMLDGTGIAIPINVVTPELRDALAERGVKFGPIRGTVGEEEKAELQAELKRIKTLQKEARKKAAETDSGEQDVNLLAEANADQKRAGGSYVSPADLEQVMIEEAGNVSFRLSNNNRATIGKWLDKWSEARVDALMKRYGNGTTRESWVETLENTKAEILDYLDNIQDATTQLAWAKWFCAGTVQIGAEDMPKVRQAIKIAKTHKIDPLQYDSPMDIINQWPGEVKEDPINPGEVNTLHKAKVLPNGLVIYDVDESEESRKNMRNIINTHFGKDCSPWCLLQGTKEGKLTALSKKYWNHYDAYPKQVVFKNGKLLAFSANDTSDRVWWDKQDKSHDGIPVIGKIKGDKLGRSGNIEYDPETGEQGEVTDIHKGDKQNGHYQQWLTLDAEHPWAEVDYKDGKQEGKYITRYSSGAVQMERSMADGLANGECTTYREDGSIWSHYVAKNNRIVGESVAYHKDGTIESTIEYDENGYPTGNFRKYYSHGSLSSQGIRDGNTRTVQQFALDGTELLREVEQQGDNKIWHLTSKRRWDKNGKIESEWDRIISPLNTAYKNYDITISTDHGTGGTYIREVTGGGTPSFKVYSEISNIDGVITLKAFRAYGAGINGHQINYTERYSEDGRLVLATKDVPYKAEDGSIKYNKIDYKPGEQDFSVDELYNDFYESKIHPDAEGGPRFSVRSFEAYKGEEALDVLNSIFEDKSEKDSLPPVSISTLDEFRRVFANPVNTIFNETIKVKDDVFNKIIKNSRSNILEAILPTLEDADFGIKDIDESILYVKRYANGHEKPGVYNIAVVNKHGELEDYISSVHIKTDNNLKNKIGKGAELLIPNNRDTYGNNAQSNSTPSDANVANNSENATQSSENETTFRAADETKEKKALQEKVTGWLTDENIEWAEGKELKDVIEHFGNTPEPIAVMPSVVRANIPSLESDYLYCGKAYLIDHQANHHPELGIDEYINIQTILDSYDDIKDLSDADNLKFAFVKKLDKGYAVVVELSKENNKIILHKTFFYRDSKNKRVPYKNKPSIFEKWSEDGSTSISPAENQQPADTENISALDTSSEGKDTNNSGNATQSSENEPTFRATDEREQALAEINEGQKMADGNYVSPSGLNDIEFRISNNNRKTINSWLDKWEIARYGSKEEAAEHREFVDAWIERIDNPTTQLAWAKWFCAGKIRLGQEDMPKVEQAVELAKKAKVDPLQFDSPMAIIEQFKDRIKEKPINPDTVPTLHKAKELPDGLVTYNVDDTQESRENMRRIINTHFGKDCSPWCLLQGDGEGNLTRESAGYWNYYNAYPKQVVFKNGKLLAFSANNKKNRVWWDRMDASHKGIPITEKIPGDAIGRIGTIEVNPSTGRRLGYYRNIHKGNKQNGKYEEWGQELAFETYYVTHFKDGVYDGLSARYYQAADGNWIIRSASFYKDGGALYVKKYLKGELLAKWLYEGDRLTYYDNGEFKSTRVYDNKNSLVELGEKSEDGFTYRSVEGSPIELSYEPGEQEKLRLVATLKSNYRVSAIYEDGGHRYTTDFRNWKDGELPADMLKEICEIHNVPGEPTMENLIKFCSEKADALLEEGAALEEKYKDLMPETTIRFRTVEITPKVREKMEVIEAKARVTGTYLQAPNGAATKLSAENWAFVRTDEFKNWFGDWELALKINNLVNIIKADKEHGFKNFAEAKEWAGKNIARLYTNNETGGKGDINISKKILDKFLSESSVRKSVDKDTHMAVLKVLPDIIREGIDAEQHPDIKKDENGERKLGNEINENVTIHRVYGAVEIGGTLHRVKITLKEDRTQGPTKRVYNYEATKIELLDGQSATPVGVPRNSNNSISVANLLNGVEKSYEKGKKLLDVSKIVDENGEPRVVYHQTNSTIWVNRKTGQNFDDLDWEDKNYWQDEASQEEWEENWEEQDFYAFDNKHHGRTSSEMPAFFFSPKFDENHEYGDRTVAAFLNIKNPAVNPEIENAGRYDDAGEKAMQKLIEQGYDGFIREYDGEIDEINAFYPNQIKSATDYNGEVNSSENDIRLRMSEGRPIFGENGIEDGEREDNRTGVLGDAGRQDGRYVRSGKPSRTAQKTPKNNEEDREAEEERGEKRSGEKRTEANARVNDGIVLFRLIGEQAIKNIPEEESLRAQVNLEIAKQMKAAGKSTRAILDATGWQFGKDGKPRFEEPDFKKSQVGTLVTYDGRTGMPLEDLIDDPRLFSEYPELKDWRIKWTSGAPNTGWTSASDKLIGIAVDGNLIEGEEFREAVHPYAYNGHRKYPTYTFTSEGRGTLVHELQHAIQYFEGFAPGTSPEALEKMLRDKINDIRADYVEFTKAESDASKTPEAEVYRDAKAKNLDKETCLARQAEFLSTPEGKKGKVLMDNFIKKYHFGPYLWREAENQAEHRDPNEGEISAIASFLYEHESGEVESFTVERRKSYSDERRKSKPFYLDESIPRSMQWSLPAKQKDTADKAMQGLQFFDREAMTDMLMKTFSDVPSEIRARITDKAPENGYNFGKASVDYFSRLAEREDELTAEEKEAVTALRDNLKEALGIDILSLDDTLWSIFQTQTAGERDILTAARRAIVADRLGHTPAQEAKRKQAEDELRYSIRRDMQSASEAEMYNRANSYAWNRLKESWVDMYESVNNLVEAVEIGTGRKAESFEDIRLALNQQSSKGLNAMQKYTSDYLEPMWEAIDSVMKTTGMTYEDVVRYVMLKHAVERNDVFARRDAKAFYKAAFDNAVNPLRQERKQLEKDRKKALADGDTQLATDCETRMQEIDLQIADEQKRLDRHYTMVDNGTAAKYRELRENDYGGLTSMFSDYPGLQPRNMYRTEEEYNAAARAVRQPRYQSVAEMEAAALAEVDAFERRASGREFDNLWSRINAATKATLESQYRSNVISKEQYEAARDQFQYYVPLRGFKDTTAEDLWTYYNTELSGSFAPALIGAKGRKSEAGNPFNWIGTMASSAIAQNIKNESKLALYYFIANRPNQDLVTIQDVWSRDQVETDRYRQAHPGSTRKIFTAVYPPFTESLSSDAAKQVYDSWVQGMEQMAQSGLAYKRTNRLNVSEDVAFIDAKQEPQHIIRAKVRGKEVCLIINGSPRAAQAINGLLNVEADNDILQKVAGGFIRFLSAVNTSFNPEFWMSNMQRDLLFATMGSDIKGDGAGNFGSHLVTPAKLIKMAKAYKNNTLGNSQIENYYREFAEGGAITGYTVVNGNAYWEKKISEYIDKPVWRKAIEGIRLDKFLQYWQNLGEAVEQMARFAAYVTAREGGKDIAASVNAAKEISVNFNRKGSGKMITSEELKTLTTRSGRHLNGAEKAAVFLLSAIPWYGRKFIMFFNASVQALNAMYKLWKANPKKLLGKWATGYFAAGVMQAVIHALFDDDDDYLDIPDYTRRTNLLLGFGGVYFKWALPQEARVFYMLGDMMVNHIMGREPHKNLLGEAASAALELLPISVTDGLAGVTPSAARPFVELGQNKDFTGARIYNEMRYASDTEKKFTPRYKNALPNTGKMFINISQLLNTVSGGDKWDAGLVNIPPESIQHIVEGFGGGLLTTLNKVWETAGGAIDAAAGAKITGEELSVRRTPFLNRLLMVNDERTRNSHVTELFYYYKGEAERTKTKARQMKKEGDLEALDALQNSKDYEIYQIYKSYEKLMKKYDERIREETDPDEKKSLMRLQDEYRKEMINEISWLY